MFGTFFLQQLHGKEVVVECKFDGDRIQIHKNNSEIHFFSRNFLDHLEYEHAMSDIIAKNILVDRCILDGEMLVWDTSENRFADFGSNQEIAKAAKEGLDSVRQMCYVAFDILYVGDTSVIHQTLAERHDLLHKVVKPIKGRLEILVPNGGLNASRSPGEPCWSFVARSLDEVEKFFKESIENRDEGIVLKDLASKWEPSDRSGKWLKLKPEYVRAGSDLDVLIIGGYYGSGRRGGEVAQFLVGLAERPMPNTHPRRFISFCRVGTGLSDEELDRVVTKLKPYFRKYEYPKKAAPNFYQVTNNSKERPDVWIESPEKSVIVSITSDIRTIKSEVFAAPYSLRFPRIDRIRFDKPWYECLDVHTFVELVHSSNGTTQRGEGYGYVQDHKPKRMKAKKGEKNVSVVPSHFIQTDVSTVKSETLIFAKMMFYFANVPSSHSVDLLHKMVVENGGNFSMNLNNSVTHCIAAENRGIKFQAAKLHGDVIHYSWLLDCCVQKKLLPLQPKYFLYLSEPTKRKLEEEIDQFSDSYYVDVDITDLRQLLSNIDQTEHPKKIDYYKKKYCPKEEWARFLGCCFYFYFSAQSIINLEWKVLVELALRRLKVAVSFGGGRVCDDLSHATHVIILSGPELAVDFSLLFSSLSAEKHLLLSEGLHVVSSQWLEDCIEKDQKLPEESYSLKPNNIQEWVSASDLNLDKRSTLDKAEEQNTPVSNEDGTTTCRQATTNKPRVVTLPKKERRTGRGRSSGTNTTRGKTVVNQPRRVRTRGGNKPAKINEDESDGSGSSANLTFQEEPVFHTGNSASSGMIGKQSPTKEHLMIEGSELSQEATTVEQYPEDQSGHGLRVVEDLEVGPGNRNGAEENEKLEQVADPLQAMLMHMIPSLGNSKAKSEDRVTQDETLPVENQKTNTDLAFVDEGSCLEPNPKPEKKRKVSYKDVAGELLKDW